MTSPNGAPPYNGTLFAQGSTPPDSSSTSTDRTANNVMSNGQVAKEMLVKFEYVQKPDKKAIHILQYHRQLLTSILFASPDQLVIYCKNNKPVTQARINLLTSLAHLKDLCDVHTREGGRDVRHVIVMAFKTTKTLHDIRNTEIFMSHLKSMNAYVTEHFFPIDEWDISSLGWFRNLHPSLMNYDLIKEYFSTEIKKYCPAKTKVPTYQLSNTTPKYWEPGQDEMKTKAIQISCSRKSSKALHSILQTALKDNPIYIPWGDRRDDLASYKNKLRAQHKYLANTWTIPVRGINRQEMWYLQEEFKKTTLIQDVHPHRDTDSLGRWNLLVTKSNFKQGLAAVQSIVDNYESIVPDDANVRATWAHTRLVGSGENDGNHNSDGDKTYASLSIASLATYLTQADMSITVTTAISSFDLTSMEVIVPTNTTQVPNPPMTYQQATTGVLNPPVVTSNELLLKAELDRLRAENQQLKSLVPNNLSALPTQAQSSESTVATSLITDDAMSKSAATIAALQADLLAVKQQSNDDIRELKQGFLEMMAMFKSMQTPPLSYTNNDPIMTKEKHRPADASSPAMQSDPKRQDVKATPPKNHSVTDVTMNQHP
jgi:hypothetical protein